MTYLDFNIEEIRKFMSDLPIRKIPGVGKIYETILTGMNINSCRDAIDNAIFLYVNFSKKAFEFLLK
jgi:DNA polymerase kappa